MATDEELIGAVADGDGRALEQLCRRYERGLHQFIFRHTGGRDVDDLYQETWLRVVRAAGRFHPPPRVFALALPNPPQLSRDLHRPPPPPPPHPPRLPDAPPDRTAPGAPPPP